jgi:hypothetical protein
MEQGWLKNKTGVEQWFGNFNIPPRGVGLVPLSVIQDIRTYPNRDFVVIEDHPEEWCFHRTEHRPWSPRYQNDGHRGQN